MLQAEASATRLAALVVGRELRAYRVQEGITRLHIEGTEIGVGLAADCVQCRRPLRLIENSKRADYCVEVPACDGRGPIKRAADRALVGGLCTASEALRQVQVGVVGIVAERGQEKGEGVGGGQGPVHAARRIEDRVGRVAPVIARRRRPRHRAALQRRPAPLSRERCSGRPMSPIQVGAAGRQRQRAGRQAARDVRRKIERRRH